MLIRIPPNFGGIDISSHVISLFIPRSLCYTLLAKSTLGRRRVDFKELVSKWQTIWKRRKGANEERQKFIKDLTSLPFFLSANAAVAAVIFEAFHIFQPLPSFSFLRLVLPLRLCRFDKWWQFRISLIFGFSTSRHKLGTTGSNITTFMNVLKYITREIVRYIFIRFFCCLPLWK